jgi:hypothetical protein
MGRERLPVLEHPFLDSYLTLDVETTVGQVYRWAGTKLENVNGSNYEPRIVRASGSLRQAINQSADRVEFTISNVDRLISRAAGSGVKFGAATAGQVVRQFRTQVWQWHQLLTGIITSVSATDREATFELLSDIYASGLVGATAPVQRKCRHVFNAPDPSDPNNMAKRKGPDCGYTGMLFTCNKIFESPDGCLGRDNQHRYGGVLYDTSKDSLILPPPVIGGDNGAGPGGNINQDYPYKNWDWQLGY